MRIAGLQTQGAVQGLSRSPEAKRARGLSIRLRRMRHSTWPGHALMSTSIHVNADMPRPTGLTRSWLRRTWGAQAIGL